MPAHPTHLLRQIPTCGAKDQPVAPHTLALSRLCAGGLNFGSLCATMNETPSMTPAQYEGDEVPEHITLLPPAPYTPDVKPCEPMWA